MGAGKTSSHRPAHGAATAYRSYRRTRSRPCSKSPTNSSWIRGCWLIPFRQLHRRRFSIEPGVEGNKALVRGLRHAKAAGDPTVVGTFFAEGFRQFSAGERPFGWDHLPYEEIYAPLVEHLASPLYVRYGPLTADGDVVVEEMDIFARLDDGTVYNNWHCLFHDIRDGKIVQTREYLDTRHVWVVLGRWAPWASTPVAPRRTPRRSNLQAISMSTQTPTMFLDLERVATLRHLVVVPLQGRRVVAPDEVQAGEPPAIIPSVAKTAR